jgi:hypothetical protein
MASKEPIPQSRSNYLSPEECREIFRDFASSPWEIDIPDHQKEILEERIANYCKNGVHVTPFEEFEKRLVEELKDYCENGLDGIALDEFEKELLEELMQS